MGSTLRELHIVMEGIEKKNREKRKKDIILDYNDSVKRLKSSGLNLSIKIKRKKRYVRKKSA